ncbi:radial spoke head 10 homolog B [Punica granatum]|uniref:Radial spoke head 10 homolog B n=1 Tax=Punica granatum TaxID=22663 RepID=A0A6P8D2B8_PUNGR|nr:radial spoke head 10 homolog B [Punica granatum]
MDGQKTQSKLTRTNSSLLRSSPTIRSSIHSLSSVAEAEEGAGLTTPLQADEANPKLKSKPRKAGSLRFRTGSRRFGSVLAVGTPVFYFFSLYSRREEVATSENLLLALIFIAIALFFVTKNKAFILLTARRLVHPKNQNSGKPIQWFIGEEVDTSAAAAAEAAPETKITREGVEFYSNGDYYEGEFYRGRCNGSGVYSYYLASGRYEGDWVEGKYNGYGIESWARGSKYRGQYRQGLRHGLGVYRFYTGDSYAGEWWNGQSHGVGVQSCKDGSCYVGEFKCGGKHGLGCYYFRNGDRYAGEYFGDKIHGFGVYHFANGHCYEGSWHEGCKQGYGMYTFRNGETRCGEWDSGTLKNPLPPLTDSVLRAVQAARKAAENAIHLRRLDEQVNRAAIGANRAATAARVAAVKAVQNQMEGKFCDSHV